LSLRVRPPAGNGSTRHAALEAEADYQRDTFPYSLPPISWFETEPVHPDLPREIWITDTTFRDGQQSRAPYSVEQVVRLYELMHRLGGPQGMIRQSEFFLYSRRDREAVERCLELGHRFPEVTGWIRATLKDYELVRSVGLRETTILCSISDYQIYKKMGSDRRTTLDGYRRVVEAALADGVTPRCGLEDITRADIPNVVVPFVSTLMELGRQAGIQVKIRYPDTMGVGVPDPHASLPRGIPRLTRVLREEAGVPAEALEFHGQNDFDAIVANAVAAWMYGAASNNGTLLGIGERSGNTPIEALVFWLISLTGDAHGMDTTVITEIADYYRSIGEPIPDRAPFVGQDFNTTRAGVHADGMVKDEETYNPFDTTALLNRPPGVDISDKSGAAGLLMWMRRHQPELAAGLGKRDPRLDQVLQAVQAQYDLGRVTSLSNAEVADLVSDSFGRLPLSSRY
jgi:citrate (Re)-synthase